MDEVYPWLNLGLKYDVITKWDQLAEAFLLRHALIHGDQGTTGLEYAEPRIEEFLQATRQVSDMAKQHGYDLCKPIRRRLKPRST